MSLLREDALRPPAGARAGWAQAFYVRWRDALACGVGIALVHRAVLMIWATAVWRVMQPYLAFPPDVTAQAESGLPALASPWSVVLGVWRRWDANHYLHLATFGYRPEDPGPSVFGVLSPFSFAAADRVLPGPVDLAAAVVETLAFAAALTLLYRLVEVDYGDRRLARMSVLLTALIPISYFFVAPASESIYLACVLFFFYSALRGRWGLAALGGFLAALARPQGAALAGIGGVIVLQQVWQRDAPLRANLRRAVVTGFPLAIVPLAYAAFMAYRQARGLPPVDEVYRSASFVFFTDPLSGLYWTLRYLVENPLLMLTSADYQAIPVCFGLAIVMLRDPRHRRLPMLLYVWGYWLLFFTKMNWTRDTDEITYAQSVARYALALFPLTIVFADRVLLAVRPATRRRILFALFVLLLITSARHVLYLAGP